MNHHTNSQDAQEADPYFDDHRQSVRNGDGHRNRLHLSISLSLFFSL